MDSVSQRKIWLCDPPRGLTARSLVLRDLDKVKALGDASFAKRWSLSDYQYFITSEASRSYCLENESGLVAYVLSLLAQGDLDIASVATHSEHRRKGYAAWLISRVDQMTDVKRAYLEVDEINTSAIQLYEKNRFVRYGVRKKYYEGKRDALLLRKVL